eukprot:gene9254-11340_t
MNTEDSSYNKDLSTNENIQTPTPPPPQGWKQLSLNEILELREGHAKSTTPDNPIYSEISEIFSHLFLTGEEPTRNVNLMKSLGISVVVNVAEECLLKNYSESDGIAEIKYKVYDIVQNEREQKEQYDNFFKMFEIFERAEMENKRCIIHCARGRSRSATVVIAYAMYKNKWDLQTAFNFVKNKRNLVGPHYNLKLQLLRWEKFYYKVEKNSVNIYHFTHRGYK